MEAWGLFMSQIEQVPLKVALVLGISPSGKRARSGPCAIQIV